MALHYLIDNTKMAPSSELWEQYLAEKRIDFDLPRMIALWFYPKQHESYASRSFLGMGQTFEFTFRWADAFLKDVNAWGFEVFEQFLEYMNVLRPYVLGLIGMKIWADRIPVGA